KPHEISKGRSYNQGCRNIEFPIQSGVRQGDVASPLLFNIVTDAIMRKAFEGRCGVQYDVNNFLTDLMFADNSAIFADTDAEATDILRQIVHKTKVMTTDGSEANIHLDGIQIEQVQEFKCLGSLVQEKKVASTTKVHKIISLQEELRREAPHAD
uniref:Reverse transcriptase domain-containing protein n=1 Tax=Scleropages formosus TaxID=113540 RepID=A0A8C9V5H6_SCLFO